MKKNKKKIWLHQNVKNCDYNNIKQFTLQKTHSKR